MGRIYRHTTPDMQARVAAVLEARLAVTLEVAAKLVDKRATAMPEAARWQEWRAGQG
jgi:hypothetical protein